MKNTGLFWWIDRWRKSSAFMDMTLEQQGAYRNLLDEAHLRGGALPNDERILAKACGDALAWTRVQTAVMARFELLSDGWHNETLDAIIAKTKQLSEKRSKSGTEGNRKRWHEEDAKPIAKPIANASSPDPDPDPDPDQEPSPNQDPIPVTKVSVVRAAVSVLKGGNSGGSSRSNRPIFRGDRFVVFDWMLDDISQMLGPAFENFGLDEFFDRLDKIAARQNVILPKQQVWPWIQSRVIAEAASRGMAVVAQAPKPHKRDVRDAEAVALMRSVK